MAEVVVVSIGAMSYNELWGEREPVRTGHATTSLVRTSDAVILVDPGLPAPALRARLEERTGLSVDAVTHVFLTSFRPDVRCGLELFERAEWLISAVERETVGLPMAEDLKRLAEAGALDDEADEESRAISARLQREVALLQRCRPAPDSIAPGVDLFPLPGVTAGMTGLLIPSSRGDILICGDAIPTAGHIAAGRAPLRCQNPEAARESLREAIEIADFLIPGRDNLMPNPVRRMFAGPVG
ncbi:MAG: hypothetical protein Kow0022_14690 [Phycisphaerales bacterium]